MDAMLLLSKTFRTSWSIGLAAVLLAAVPPGRLGRAENIVGGAFASDLLDPAASEGAFRHLRVLQEIASMSGGNRAAGTKRFCQRLQSEEHAEGRFGSDGVSFSQKGIPIMGLYTGAGGLKSEAQASLFGGMAGRPYDPCYHRVCDTIENINRDVLEQNTRALVRALNAAAIAAKR